MLFDFFKRVFHRKRNFHNREKAVADKKTSFLAMTKSVNCADVDFCEVMR